MTRSEVRWIPCGEFVNESERIAVSRLKSKLDGSKGAWILLSNLDHSSHPSRMSDEIDLVVIGPAGVFVVEVKHWDKEFLRQNPDTVEREAEKISKKAKKVAGKLKNKVDAGFVTPRILLTRGELRFDGDGKAEARGVSFFGLPECAELVGVGTSPVSEFDGNEVARLLEPKTRVALTGDIRRFAGLINLERTSDKLDTFHRIYRGQHPTRRDKVILHLYDLSARKEKQAEQWARREFDVIQAWQKAPFVPSMLDSFQEAPDFPGELHFFSLVDPAAPSIEQRVKDPAWNVRERISYCAACSAALAEFHEPDDPQLPPLIHRAIHPLSLRVRHDGQPLFTEFSLSRLDDQQTVSGAPVEFGTVAQFVAPEVRSGGLASAIRASDVFSLSKSLLTLFPEESEESSEVRKELLRGCYPKPEERPTAIEMARALKECLGGTVRDAKSILPAADYWDEGTIVPFRDSQYKVVNKLGRGGIGQTFKVVEVDSHTQEEYGTYVAKTVAKREDGDVALLAYRRVRSHTHNQNLSVIHEIAPEWNPNQFVALMRWVEGFPLQDLAGVVQLHAEEVGNPSPDALALRWILEILGALSRLHQAGLVHGDVSPRNIIVQGQSVVLTDYDTVVPNGSKPRGGTIPYCSPSVQSRERATASDDVYSAAASFFHVVFDREPFLYGAERQKFRGLNIEGLDGFKTLVPFLQKATHPTEGERFRDAMHALSFLESAGESSLSTTGSISPEPSPQWVEQLSEQVVPWLDQLLSAYPGSRHGNSETRGLDSEFARSTYVEAELDASLLADIESGTVNLVVLFGNAGDGKTAFLQNLGQCLGVGDVHSRRRVWQHELKNGRVLHANLDGAAAWQDRTANDLLNEFFRPFMNGNFPCDRVHILAINNGKLLEWIEEQDADTFLTKQLRDVLLGVDAKLDPRIRLIDLNLRSLVGGIDPRTGRISTAFLDQLLDRMLGSPETWQACRSCVARSRCTARHSAESIHDKRHGPELRSRLHDILQVCHQRGEIHITARELRAALVYMFFGIHSCSDLHVTPDLQPAMYWQRAFDADSEGRQGELLDEMAKLDPALEADPKLDRHLLKLGRETGRQLEEERRRAYFERERARGVHPPTLPGARHSVRFRELPQMSEEERSVLCKELCRGISKLEDLPARALRRNDTGGLPIRIPPRTPTESMFWVLKPWQAFRLEPRMPKTAPGLETLHTHIDLVYRDRRGIEDRLTLGLELFHLLLELEAGTQITSSSQDGVFANLEVFAQRLAREEAREVIAWNPAEDGKVFKVRINSTASAQVLKLEVAE